MNPTQVAETLQCNNETAPTTARAAGAAAASDDKNDREIIPFMARRDELASLAKHWAGEAINDELGIFLNMSVGRADLDRIDFAWGRLGEIKQILGAEETEKAIREADAEAADSCSDPSHWIVFRYGTWAEQRDYEDAGGHCFLGFKPGVAENLAAKVMERVFREAPEEVQIALLREELTRCAKRMKAKVGYPHEVVEIFGVGFPSVVKPMLLSAGIDEPNTFCKKGTLEQGKAVLPALKAATWECEDASSLLVKREMAAE